ncbi:MAG: winged helix-turn-helix transcriptional regulator [Rhodospirillaceae bacterium]|jgi:DNA-binding MarR family transcriptional regulator|nr:winged helix-turn-helix transcriptional regulator [Rhodospirillaceae bacterium]MBT5944901.1 winged helix-turn-helix transcriptional regulator [Rhodospirillaceae bacterium]MBT6405499.1 winged helix-turn-helix transcriptional regulator [Rhodospirillaceae bacterium]MBT6535685.1 winged helix-turn-helix transcriptional regulator [Rhodospirillaceae bacterium]MBT7360479.1 winged helix-turn-helix transcriptional regulator [Rhodospirillaceae bacterium]
MKNAFDIESLSLERRLSDGLTRLSAVARQLDWQTAETESLTPTQADILRFVCSRPEGTRLAAGAAHAGVRSATASEAVSTLERKGLLAKDTDPEDKRAILLRATASGQAMAGAWPSSFDRVVSGLDTDEQENALRLVVKMIQSLQIRGLIAPQRTCVSCKYFKRNATPDSATPHLCALVGVPFADRDLRVDCPDHLPAAA